MHATYHFHSAQRHSVTQWPTKSLWHHQCIAFHCNVTQDGTHNQTNTTLIWNNVPKSLDVLVDDDDAMQIHPKIGWEATQYQLHSTAKLAQNDLHQTYKIRLAKCFRVQMNPTAVQVQLLHTCFFGSEMTIGTCSGGARSKKIRLKQPTNRKQHSRWE